MNTPIHAKQKLFEKWGGIMVTAALWMIYIETAACTCQNSYFLENIKNKQVCIVHIVE